MISEAGRKAISEAQKARHAKETKPLPTATHQHQWIADEYVVVPNGMFLKWVICPACGDKLQIREP